MSLVTPDFRFRRLRRTPVLRALVRETQLSMNDFILPIFVEEGIAEPVPIKSMPDVFRYPESELAAVVQRAWRKGVRAIILFGVSSHKDETGSDTWHSDGLMARMIRIAKQAQPEMLVISDNCFCEYTSHGHCGVIHEQDVLNDETLANLQKQVVLAAAAGVDMIAPSGMMDGMIAAIRQALDEAGFNHIPVMSYSTKFASAFYGPFRDAVDSNFKGSRSSYQMDPANSREALAESLQDEAEGADILMVKPGLAYLDVLANIRAHSIRPLAVYQVSGEYAMIKAGAQAGVIDEKAIVLETMTAFKRAGADLIITYYAEKMADWL
ncbi:porphobilinogen synthase [Cellvibrio japonicus]|uniref:Delta-aminolevulinic acid dehydratase n=1 Tax=Cellvibrio japonicus (strain Ueda107) TaxID=498211 RepID=B3PGQ5_CELJU|nr:porphobilinogen synthase [Cellvibrio japonicus]ACE83750.1 delta-aminolevulinic acid dehydratase [Cellvibrio japonicus Ueda107]QEI12400.1 porphobilinogen synthase [Cellvibrio japonicus]QEI15973.1 porphobilinogen synthase [Cellvibrio japonicus]QEI19552.1 porphobilinogen synthase [Cellvibrio japonicus]